MRVLLAGEDASAFIISNALIRDGYVVDEADTLDLTTEAVYLHEYRLVILTSSEWRTDRLDLLRLLNGRSPGTGVVVIAANDESASRTELLDAGADDCIWNPRDEAEVFARIRAVLRRLPRTGHEQSVKVGAVSYRPATHELSIAGLPFVLPRRELAIFDALARRANRVVPHGRLEQAVYGIDDEIESNALISNISRLRQRLSKAGAGVSIRPVRGVGYSLEVMVCGGTHGNA